MSFFFLIIQLTIVIMLYALGFNYTVHAIEHVDSNSTKSIGGYNNEIFYISNNTGHSEEPQIIKNENNIYILWIDDTSGSRNIYFKKSTDNGSSFGPTIDLGVGKGGSLDPKMVVSGNHLYVIWEYTPENNGMIFWTRSTDNGASFGAAKNLGNNTGFNGFPQIAASGNNVYVTWHDASDGIVFVRSTDNGASFGAAKNLGNNTGFNGFPQIAAVGNNVYVAWTNSSHGNNGQIFFTRSTDSGASFGSPFLINKWQENSADIVFSPTIAAGENSVYLVWHSGRVVQHARVSALISDVFFTRSTDGGASFGDITNLSNYSGWGVDPQIAVSQDNGVYVVWTNNAQDKYGQIFFTGSTDGGASFGDITNLSNYSGWGVDPQIAVSQDNGVYVVWTNNATRNEEIILKKGLKDLNNYVSSNTPEKTERADNIRDNVTISERAKKIAFVEDTFTQAAYDKSFYMFYEIYYPYIKAHRDLNFTKYTDLLYSKLIENSKDSSRTHQIVNHLKWLTPKSTIDVLGDEDVHNASSVFTANGTNVYDLIILTHLEYVSQQEYDNLKRYVANGGILMLLAGNTFYAEVEYDENSRTIRLVNGHDFAFNGKTAWKGDRERWANESLEWVGSNYACCFGWDFTFHNDPFGIPHIEEQSIKNPEAKILLDYNVTVDKPEPRQHVIATYELEYKEGKVIGLGLYTVSKLFDNERFLRFFDSLLFQYLLADS